MKAVDNTINKSALLVVSRCRTFKNLRTYGQGASPLNTKYQFPHIVYMFYEPVGFDLFVSWIDTCR